MIRVISAGVNWTIDAWPAYGLESWRHISNAVGL